MGGRPIFALAIVGMPLDKLPVEVIRASSPAASRCAPRPASRSPADIRSTRSSRSTAWSRSASCIPDQVKRNDRAQAGDVLVLGKPLGVGILSAALKKGVLSAAGYARDARLRRPSSTRPATRSSELAGVHALTDVTGFGLAGHLLEICRGSKLGARVRFDASAADRGGARRGRSRASRPARPAATGRATAREVELPAGFAGVEAGSSSPTRRRAAGCSSPARRTRPSEVLAEFRARRLRRGAAHRRDDRRSRAAGYRLP